MNDKPTVIITDTHTRMALAVVRELGRLGYEITSVTRQGCPSLGHASRYTTKRITLPAEGYGDALLQLAEQVRPVLLPAGMVTLEEISKRHRLFSNAFDLLVPEADDLTNASDKPTVAEAARKLNIAVPKEYAIDDPAFPCVIKYRNGEALRLKAEARYAIAHDKTQYHKMVTDMQKRGEVFVSEYIAGKAKGVSAILDKNAEPLAIFCHERVREYPLSGGPSCCAKSIRDEKLITQAMALLKSMRLKGFAMVEFKGEHVLEINPRVWGTYPLSRLCGAGMAEAYVRGARGEVSSLMNCKRYNKEIYMQFFFNDMMHLFARLRKGRIAWDVIKDTLDPRVKGGVLDVKDIPGSWAYIKNIR